MSIAPRIAHETRSLAFIGFPDSFLPESTIDEGLVLRTAFVIRTKPPANSSAGKMLMLAPRPNHRISQQS